MEIRQDFRTERFRNMSVHHMIYFPRKQALLVAARERGAARMLLFLVQREAGAVYLRSALRNVWEAVPRQEYVLLIRLFYHAMERREAPVIICN